MLAPSPLDRPQDAQCRLLACGRQGARRHGGCPQGQCAWPRICSGSRAGLPLPGFLRSAPQAAATPAAAGGGSESEPLHDAVRHRPPRRQPRQEPSGVQDAVLHGPGQAPRPARQARSPSCPRRARARCRWQAPRPARQARPPPPRPRHGQSGGPAAQDDTKSEPSPGGPGTGRAPSHTGRFRAAIGDAPKRPRHGQGALPPAATWRKECRQRAPSAGALRRAPRPWRAGTRACTPCPARPTGSSGRTGRPAPRRAASAASPAGLNIYINTYTAGRRPR